LLGNDSEISNYKTGVANYWPVNSNRVMVLSVQSVLMAAHVKMEYVMPPLSNNCTARGLCQHIISKSVSGMESVSW
jgi:hypothetical protein